MSRVNTEITYFILENCKIYCFAQSATKDFYDGKIYDKVGISAENGI
jgi:hypothetical protein